MVFRSLRRLSYARRVDHIKREGSDEANQTPAKCDEEGDPDGTLGEGSIGWKTALVIRW